MKILIAYMNEHNNVSYINVDSISQIHGGKEALVVADGERINLGGVRTSLLTEICVKAGAELIDLTGE